MLQINVTDIAVINRQRTELDGPKVVELANSIAARGLLHPIVVRLPHDDEKELGLPYVLMVGGRRLAAHMYLGRETIEANVYGQLEPVEAELAELEENLIRENISWQDEVAARARIHTLRTIQNPLQNAFATAEEIAVDPATLSRDLQLARLIKNDPALLTATSKGAALRQAKFKKGVKDKLANVERSSEDDLRKLLVTAEWMTFTKDIATASVDLVLSDLPYGIDQFEVQASGENHVSKFDDSKETVLPDIEAVIPELIRITKADGWICLFMSYEHHFWLMEQFRKHGLNPELPPWIWVRHNQPGNYGHYPELHAANRYEMIVLVNRGSAQFMKKPIENVLAFPSLTKEEKVHNHQKPHDLLKEILSRLTVPGDLVIDICFGSGAHLAAASDMGRAFRGCEKNPVMLDPALVTVAQYFRTSHFRTPEGGHLAGGKGDLETV